MRFTRKRLGVLMGVIAVAVAVAVPVALGMTFVGSLSADDRKMTHERLLRIGDPSTCHGAKSNPGTTGPIGRRSFDKYSFTNNSTSARCVNVRLQHNCEFAGGGTFNAFAHANAPFVPSDPSLNYLGDASNSASPQHFAFRVAAGQRFDVVVGAVDPDSAHPPYPCNYTLDVNFGINLP